MQSSALLRLLLDASGNFPAHYLGVAIPEAQFMPQPKQNKNKGPVVNVHCPRALAAVK
jgi:hypothetical protein